MQAFHVFELIKAIGLWQLVVSLGNGDGAKDLLLSKVLRITTYLLNGTCCYNVSRPSCLRQLLLSLGNAPTIHMRIGCCRSLPLIGWKKSSQNHLLWTNTAPMKWMSDSSGWRWVNWYSDYSRYSPSSRLKGGDLLLKWTSSTSHS